MPLTHTFEVPERLAADGTVLTPLDEGAARRVAERVAGLGVAAVAICLLHAHADDEHISVPLIGAAVRALERSAEAFEGPGGQRGGLTTTWCTWCSACRS